MLKKLSRKAWNAAVFWTLIYSFLRIASGILLLPLLIRELPKEDLGMYINFFYLAWILPLLDSTFSTALVRYKSYAMSGVESIRGFGLDQAREGAPPNLRLLGQLLGVTRKIYGMLSVFALVVLGIGGTLSIWKTVPETSNPALTWMAWVVLLGSAPLELYTSSWLVSLRGLNQMVLAARLGMAIYGLKLALSCVFLLVDLKLMAVPLATMVTAVVQRFLARRFTLKKLPAGVHVDHSADRQIVKHVWPTSWRLGLQLVSGWLALNTILTMISHVDLSDTGEFGLSYLILSNICVSIASTWTYVKWPMVNQYRAGGKLAELRAVMAPRVWLASLTYLGLAGMVVLIGPWFIQVLDPAKTLLEREWLILLGLLGLLELNVNFWGTLLSTENRIPTLWAAVITNMAIIVVSFGLYWFTGLTTGAFVLGPLLSQLVFNAWFWPRVGARGIGTSWTSFMFDLRGARLSGQ